MVSLITRVGPAIVCLVISTITAKAQLWTFDSNAQGWQINDVTGSGNYATSQGNFTANWNPNGGTPGGFISALDPSNFSFMFQAPTAQLGNYSQFAGGRLQFSLTTDLFADYSADSVVVLRGGASNQLIVAGITPQPDTGWTSYSIALQAGNFHYDNLSGATVSGGDFQSVLGQLNEFMIDGEYHSGVSETTGLDSCVRQVQQKRNVDWRIGE
jgi:hypothetical protein